MNATYYAKRTPGSGPCILYFDLKTTPRTLQHDVENIFTQFHFSAAYCKLKA